MKDERAKFERVKFGRALRKLTMKAELVLAGGRAYVRLEGKRRWWRISEERVVRVSYDPVLVHGRSVSKGRYTLTWGTLARVRDALIGFGGGAALNMLAGRVQELVEVEVEVEGQPGGVHVGSPEGIADVDKGLSAAMGRLSEHIVGACQALQKGEQGQARVAIHQVRREARDIEKALQNGVAASG